MNIFYLDLNPVRCAQMHNDKHVVKMILESAQLLSTAHRVLDGNCIFGYPTDTSTRRKTYYVLPDDREGKLYSATHVNHPCAIWTRQSSQNYWWLVELMKALTEEYTYRYGKHHKCEEILKTLMCMPFGIPKDFGTPVALAMPDDVKVIGDPVTSYRNYYIKNKQHLAKWTKRSPPEWYPKNADVFNS